MSGAAVSSVVDGRGAAYRQPPLGPVPSEQPVPRGHLGSHRTPSSKSASLPRVHTGPVPSEQPVPRGHLGSHRTPSSKSASLPRGHGAPLPSEKPVLRFLLGSHRTPSSQSASSPRGHTRAVPTEQPVPHFHLGSHRTPSSPSASSPRGHAAPMEDKTLVTTTTTSVAKAKRFKLREAPAQKCTQPVTAVSLPPLPAGQRRNPRTASAEEQDITFRFTHRHVSQAAVARRASDRGIQYSFLCQMVDQDKPSERVQLSTQSQWVAALLSSPRARRFDSAVTGRAEQVAERHRQSAICFGLEEEPAAGSKVTGSLRGEASPPQAAPNASSSIKFTSSSSSQKDPGSSSSE
ncbi:uncharacterized protein LOC144120044 [Amblyomma americanum]